MKPFIKTGHRFGHVFLHLVHSWMGKRATHVWRMTPAEAKAIGDELLELATRAEKKHVPLKIGKAKR